jgi:putative phosphotransacetylase
MDSDGELVGTITRKILRGLAPDRFVMAGVSNRHLHLSRRDADVLFGVGHEPEILRELRQPGQYACRETVALATRGGYLENLRLLGPIRDETQVELSASDARGLGISLPLMRSGQGGETPEVTLIGPRGSIVCSRGVGLAWRHLHLSPSEGKFFGLADGEEVDVETLGERAVLFRRVWVRVRDDMISEFHIDTDEANAAGLSTGDRVRVL